MAKTVILRFAGDSSHLNRTLSGIESRMSQVGSSMTRTGARMTAGITLPLAFVAKAAVGTAMEYERNMDVLQAASKASNVEMAKMGKLAMALGADMKLPGTSASDAAEAMVELSKAGLDVNEIMGATRGVLQLSAAGELSNADAANIAAGALNAFGLKGTEAARVADLLAGAANSSQGSVADMALALQDGGAVFASAGIPLEDFITMTAMLAKKGVGGAVAGTALKTMVQRLQKPLKPAAAALEFLGKRIGQTSLSMYDMKGKIKPTLTIIDEFSRATKGLTGQQRGSLLTAIFGADGIKGAEFALTAGTAAFKETNSDVTELAAAEKMATSKTKGLAGAIDGLKSAMETFSLQVVLPLLPKLTALVNRFSALVPRIAALPKPVLAMAAGFVAFLAAAGPLAFIGGSVVKVFAGIAAIAGVISLPLIAAAVAIGLLGAALFAVLNPSKAGALVDGFKDKWAEIGPGIKARLGSAFEALKMFGAKAGQWIVTNGPIIAAKLASWGQAFLGWIGPLIPPFLVKLGTFLGAIGTWILDTGLPLLSEKMKGWIPALSSWIGDALPGIMLELAKLLIALDKWIFMDALPKLLTSMVRIGIDIAAGFGDAIFNGIKAAMNVVIRQINNMIEGMNDIPFLPDLPKLPEFGMGADKKTTPVDPRAIGPTATGALPGKTFAPGAMGPAAGAPIGGKTLAPGSMGPALGQPIGMATGGLLTARRPTPLLVGEGRGAEDVLAVPHSKGGIGGLGTNFTNNYYGVSLEEAMERSKREAGWRMAIMGRR